MLRRNGARGGGGSRSGSGSGSGARSSYTRLMLSLVAVAIVAAAIAATMAGCPGPEQELAERVVDRFSSEPKLTLYSHKTDKKTEIGLEEYITGVVAGEMKPEWPKNAYAAQAIVARTFTLELLSRGGTRDLHGADICDNHVHAQAYNPDNITQTIKDAVRMTRGEVMIYRNRYVKGWFSASCGGRTTNAKTGLAYKGKEPAYIKSVSCKESRITPPEVKKWSADIDSETVLQALKKLGKPLPNLSGAQIAKRVDNRAAVLRLSGGGKKVEIDGADFRVAVGPEKMRSIWLTQFEVKDGRLITSGTGFGHGVGLCQWGANELARENSSPEEIVKHYFPKVTIKRLWR